MPEIPELEIYARRIVEVARGARVTAQELATPFLLRTAEIPLDQLVGLELDEARRAGKHLAVGFTGDGPTLWLVLHLMLAGRVDWKPAAKNLPKRGGCFKLTFDNGGALQVLERSTKKRAALYVVRAPEDVSRVSDSPVDPLSASFTVEHLAEVLDAENTQIKNALTHWRRIGLGNAYADEVLRAAGLSPLKLTRRMSADEVEALHGAIRGELSRWIDVIDGMIPGKFPVDQKVWRRTMAVHGRHGEPCGACGETVARISYAERETHYCPACQTGGKLLADRRLSRFLK